MRQLLRLFLSAILRFKFGPARYYWSVLRHGISKSETVVATITLTLRPPMEVLTPGGVEQ